MNVTKYHGITSVLPEAQSANGETYPFAYHPKIPAAKSWSYRLLSPEGASPLTAEALTAAIQQSPFRFLMADWHGYEGYPLAVIEIHLPSSSQPDESGDANKSGDAGTTPQRIRIEKGPELNMDRGTPKPPPPTKTPELPSLRPLRTPESFQPKPTTKQQDLTPDLF